MRDIILIVVVFVLFILFSMWETWLKGRFLKNMLEELHNKFYSSHAWRQAILEVCLIDEYEDFMFEPYKVGKKMTKKQLKKAKAWITERANKINNSSMSEWEEAQYRHFRPVYERLQSGLEKYHLFLVCLERKAAVLYFNLEDGKFRVKLYDYDADALFALIEYIESYKKRQEKIQSYFSANIELCTEEQKKRYEEMKSRFKKAAEDDFLWYSDEFEGVVSGALEDLPEWLQKKEERAVV